MWMRHLDWPHLHNVTISTRMSGKQTVEEKERGGNTPHSGYLYTRGIFVLSMR